MSESAGEYAYEESFVGAWTVRRFDSIDSTNRYLADAARAGERGRIVAVARHQTAGRGRRGRVWDDKPGASLLFSVLFAEPAMGLHLFTQAVGLAVADACKVVAGVQASLKWPNDVLIGERKVAGVLAETASDTGALVVGCGINLNWGDDLPTALSDTAVSLDTVAGTTIPIDAFLESVLQGLTMRLGRPDWLPDAYRSRCATLGRHVKVERTDRFVEGKAIDLTEEGGLVIETTQGTVTVTLGDVVHLRGS